MTYEPRWYRDLMSAKGLVSFEVTVLQTDLHISARKDLSSLALRCVERFRADIESFIAADPVFKKTLVPHDVPETSPPIIKAMADAAARAGVGPMAAVAGAISEFVGRELMKKSEEVIVENGGDIFITTESVRKMLVYAGDSPLSERLCLLIQPEDTPLGVCTSSGTVGHSLSFGKADAVVVVSRNTALADAYATALGNRIQSAQDIDPVIKSSKTADGIDGVVLIKGDKMGVWGNIELVKSE